MKKTIYPKPTIGLCDGDLLIFSICAAAEYDKEEEQLTQGLFTSICKSIDSKLTGLISHLNLSEMRVFLSSNNNFRHTLMPEYKANRADVWRPHFLSDAKEYAVQWWDAEMQEGLEADDLMAYYQHDFDTVIITIDKDLLQVQGHHYRWETVHSGEKYLVVDGYGFLEVIEKLDAKGKVKSREVKGHGPKFFLWQCLTGDPTDGIMGCGEVINAVYKSGKKAGEAYTKRKGVGALAAFGLLELTTNYEDGLAIVKAQYAAIFADDADSELNKQGGCLWMAIEMVGKEFSFPVMWSCNDERHAYHPSRKEVLQLRG